MENSQNDFAKENLKQGRNFKKVLSVVVDIMTTLVLIVLLAISICIVAIRGNNGFVGINLGVIQSGSMVKSGYYIGDVVSTHKQNEYEIGDVIVFYRAVSSYNKEFDKNNIKNSPIWVHEVIDIKTDALGRKTYLTKGSSNAKDDAFYVPQDFVLGKAKKVPAFFNGLLRFISSVQGIICTVIVPCSIMLVVLFVELFQLIMQKPSAEEEVQTNKRPYRNFK